jgi:hypothetical protein
MCEISESESVERRLDSLAAENDRLLRDRRRVAAFIGSRTWDVMNERRAELIGRDTDGGLSDAERAELATLQLAVDVLIGVRGCLPDPDDGKWKDTAIRSLQAEVARLKAEAERFRGRAERLARLNIFVPDWGDGTERWVFTGDFGKVPFAAMTKVVTHGEAMAVLDRAIGPDAAPAGGVMVRTPEQYDLGYAVPSSFRMQGGTFVRREPYRLVRRLPDGNYLVEAPSAPGPADGECQDGQPHRWGIDGQHGNEYCKRCFVSKPAGEGRNDGNS